MKVTFVGHSSILVETGGLRILSDPWWGNPCFGAQWWNYPRSIGPGLEDVPFDYIYISHGHHDHLHPGTLRRLDRSAKVLLAAGLNLADAVREHGFEVLEIGDDEERDLGAGVRCRIMRTHGDDSLMMIADGKEVCANLNDALHAAPAHVQAAFVSRLRGLYPQIDYVFCGYGVASHFPNCYRIPGKNPEATAAARQHHFNQQWAGLVAGLAPRFAFPFAADVVFLQNELFWANEPTHNSERPLAALAAMAPGFAGQTFDIAPGFVIEDGRITAPVKRQPILAATLRHEMADEIEKANRFGTPDREVAESLQRLVAENLVECRAFFASCPGDYRMLIRLAGSDLGIVVTKQGEALEAVLTESASAVKADVTITTRAQYLRTSLTREYGNETLFVGSGILFDYASREQAERNLQREAMVMLRENATPPPPRPPAPNPLISSLKGVAKRMLGRDTQDLYDLKTWTMWSNS